MRVCAEPGCPTLTRTRRCTTHTAQAEAARGTRQQRGYDAEHMALRAQWQRVLDTRAVDCWRCGLPIPRGSTTWHLGHDDHDRSIHRGPEHETCNTSEGGKASHRHYE